MKFTTSFDPEIAQKVGLLEAIVHAELRGQALLLQKKSGSERPAIEHDIGYFEKIFHFASPEHVARAIKRLTDARYVTEVDGFLEVDEEKKKADRRKKGAPIVTSEVRVITYARSDGHGGDEIVESTLGKLVAEMIDGFKAVNPSYQDFFRQKRFRKPLEEMIDTYSIPEIFRLIELLPITNQMKFAPVITNPIEFKALAPKLIFFIQKEKVNKPQQVSVNFG